MIELGLSDDFSVRTIECGGNYAVHAVSRDEEFLFFVSGDCVSKFEGLGSGVRFRHVAYNETMKYLYFYASDDFVMGKVYSYVLDSMFRLVRSGLVTDKAELKVVRGNVES